MLLTLTFSIWSYKFQVLDAARALFKLNAHYETVFPLSDKNMYV